MLEKESRLDNSRKYIYIYIYSYNKSEDCDGIIGFFFFWLSLCSLDLYLISNGACVFSSTVQILKDHCVETCEGRSPWFCYKFV